MATRQSFAKPPALLFTCLFPHEFGWIGGKRSLGWSGGRCKCLAVPSSAPRRPPPQDCSDSVIHDLPQQAARDDSRQQTPHRPHAGQHHGPPPAALITCVLRAPHATRMPSPFIHRLTLDRIISLSEMDRPESEGVFGRGFSIPSIFRQSESKERLLFFIPGIWYCKSWPEFRIRTCFGFSHETHIATYYGDSLNTIYRTGNPIWRPGPKEHNYAN
jgi:hypothetical protein